MDELMQQVDGLYERAVFNGEYDVLPAADRALDAVEAALPGPARADRALPLPGIAHRAGGELTLAEQIEAARSRI